MTKPRITNKSIYRTRSSYNVWDNEFITILNNTVLTRKKRDIWMTSTWKQISQLDNNDVGNIGEETIASWCKSCNIECKINGPKAKVFGCDGMIKGFTCEIKTARLSSGGRCFQHEMGETPWKAEYILFVDIAPDVIYVTIFKNFSKKHYLTSGKNNNIKCKPYFPNRSICWRKKTGAFKLDTSLKINESNINKYTFKFDKNTSICDFADFINSIIPNKN